MRIGVGGMRDVMLAVLASVLLVCPRVALAQEPVAPPATSTKPVLAEPAPAQAPAPTPTLDPSAAAATKANGKDAKDAKNGEATKLTARITSPMGRTGEIATVRIVAQIKPIPETALSGVQFFVDGKLLATVEGGPPYATEWVDENPFVNTEITVSVADNLGNTATDKIVLKAFEVTDLTEVSRVLLDTIVQDKDGKFVRNLGHQDFTVLEDGVPQTLDLAGQDHLPATFAMLVDSSQSMSRRIDFVREAANRLVGYMRPTDRMIIVPFSKTLQPITGPTDDRDTVLDAISKIEPRGGTAILDSLIELSPHLGGLEGRRAIVLITDGYDEHSTAKIDDALTAVKDVGATVYVVGIGGVAGISLQGERFFKRLAKETGGRAFLPSRETELAIVHDVLSSDVQNRYLLSYTPANQALDGKWREITVMTSNEEYAVRSRNGYFAPKPPPVRATLEFTVTDAEDGFPEVTSEDLIVVENGVEQKIESFTEAINPVSIILALDASGSMRKAAQTAKEAALRFVDALRPEDKLGLALFADSAEIVEDLGSSRSVVREGIEKYVSNGGTALYDALAESLERLNRVEGRRVIVIVSDGRDENNPGTGPGSRWTYDQVLASAREVDAAIFSIGMGPNVDRKVLEELAAASGGEAYFPQDVTQLDAEYARVIETLRRRWIITYSSTDTNRNGEWRTVEIKTHDPNTVVRSRGGYFAPRK
jgi:VWFA-related protein